MGQPYEFKGRGNYGGKSATIEEQIAAYEAAPACHHPGRTLPKIPLEMLGVEEQSAIVANSEADGLDTEWQALSEQNS